MKLSDIMSNAGLAIYAQVALVLFLLAFVGVAVRLLLPSQQRELRAAGSLPLDDPNDRLAGLTATPRPE